MGFIVTHKLLDRVDFLYYTYYTANVLSTDKQIGIIGALCEGSSIRSIERTTAVHRDTIMRLGVRVGQGCAALMDARMRNLDCHRLEMDEIWRFIGKKDRHVRPDDDPQFGNVWTFCVIDADTKLVPTFRVSGDRDVKTATAFVLDVADRMKNRVQIFTDGLAAYVEAIDWAFGRNVDYGQIIKTYGTEESVEAQRRYSAPKSSSIEKNGIFGRPDFDLISTSYIERLNATTRLHMKRLARLTHAFSKKRENFRSSGWLELRLLQFRSSAQYASLHSSYGRWRRAVLLECRRVTRGGDVTPHIQELRDMIHHLHEQLQRTWKAFQLRRVLRARQYGTASSRYFV
jgi:IS1 family transposase